MFGVSVYLQKRVEEEKIIHIYCNSLGDGFQCCHVLAIPPNFVIVPRSLTCYFLACTRVA